MQEGLNDLHREWGDAHPHGRAQRHLGEYSGKADPTKQRSPLIPLKAGKTRIVVSAELQEQKPARDETTDKHQKPVTQYSYVRPVRRSFSRQERHVSQSAKFTRSD